MSATTMRRPPCRAAAAAVFGAAVSLIGSAARSAPLSISDTPLFLTAAAEPLIMLALSNDEQLYYKAYTDFDDLDDDGLIDSTYKDSIAYYGYFDSTKCYDYYGTEGDGHFFPRAVAGGTYSHHCDTVTNGRWSGNFLNWAAMSRMDALRKVLYGGFRRTDTSTATIVERVYIPSDNHAWIKLYSGSDLAKYTPYASASYPAGITLCNVTPQGASTNRSETNVTSPRLRIAKGAFTEWAAQESRQCLWTSEFTPVDANASPVDVGTTVTKVAEFTARVKVCDSTLIGKENCKAYGSSLKPVGLLQDFADADKLKMRFGLMTGSYGKRKSGGVLRKNISRFTNEVSSSDGTFTSVDGIVKALNLMRISRYEYSAPGYGASGGDNCPFGQNTWNNGACSNWGNPMGEMYLESLRYFAGAGASSAFASTDNSWINGLKEAGWVNPYTSNDAAVAPKVAHCSKPSIITVSTGVLSFDSNEFAGASSISGLDVNAETDAVGAAEGIHGNNWYVGSLTGGSPNDVCNSATVSALSAVTGICPQAAGLQGSFKMVGLAAYAHKSTTALQTVGTHKIKPVDTFAVALAPPTPTIKVKIDATRTVTIIPTGYNLRNSNAMQLVNFRVISQSADGKTGTYFMNYENAPAGSDFDNDMKGTLRYIVGGTTTNPTVKIIMHQTGSSAGATQNMGYIIDGTTDASNTHYLLSNNNLLSATQQGGATFSTLATATIDTACKNAGFALDPTTVANELCFYQQAGSNTPSPLTGRAYMRGVRTHAVGSAATGTLKSPLQYAAKWGGYKDKNGDGFPDKNEWDSDPEDDEPDTYFPVTDSGKLGEQLTKAFNEIVDRNASASAASVNSGSISTLSRVYQAKFNSSNWTGELIAYGVAPDTGALETKWKWNAGPQPRTGESNVPLPTAGLREIITLDSNGTPIPFKWASLDTTRKQQLDDATAAPFDATLQENRLNYLRGDATNEGTGAGTFRSRPSKLGDIVNSSPLYVGPPLFNHRDSLENKPYSTFRADNADRRPVVYVGANDGMLHAFNAKVADESASASPKAGSELLAFIPGAVFANLKQLSKQTYSHLFYVDGPPNMGDVFYSNDWHTVLVGGLNKGGKGVYALDITDPDDFDDANAGSLVLWEFTDTKAAPYGDPDLGYTFSQPAIVRLQNGKWAAVFGNGYNNTGSGTAVLYVVDIQTGERIAKLDTKRGTTTTPNGLSTPAVVDLNGDGISDYVYAGDLLGNLWKFDITGATSSTWKVSYGTAASPLPLFTAIDVNSNPQPIVSRPEVGRGPSGAGMVVLFGTGKFLEPGDKLLTTSPTSAQRPQTFYGIIDNNSGAATDIVANRSALQQQTILYEQTQTFGGVDVGVRVPSNTPRGTARGWYLDLVQPDWYLNAANGYQGERVVSNPILRNQRVIFTTLIPETDPCSFGGTSWLMELDALSGARLPMNVFDVNRDGTFGADDEAIILSGGTGSQRYNVGGILSAVGITPEPGILVSSKAEYKYSPGTTGTIGVTAENPGANAYGRQSWRQIR